MSNSPSKPSKITQKSSSPSAKRPPSGGSSRWKIVLGVFVAVAALLAGWLTQNNGGSGDQAGSGQSSQNENATVEQDPQDGGGSEALQSLARRDADDALAIGDKDAPVVMIEYADFGCSFCGKFARDTEPELVERYVDKGVLRIEWRNFPIFGKGSERAALAAWAAGEQDRFWQFHEAAYADKGAKEKGFTDEQLKGYAEEAGVSDLKRFDRDRASSAAKKAVGRDQNEAYSLGASSTPAFLINGEPIAGAQPDQVFTDAIDRAAAAAEKKEKGSGK
ncbi:thioredoxin domain-containing protein [Streptomyces sp. HNM0574]|uniref:DsbA family protein n=1 Tax=Streptomyces sp. HNM0574 TaxID=2714954 RepID=UPI00146CA186|nr:thioredoxin domain-containing protein [Streptomyces sp. HNM0574]NLU68489.1 thioredoxin domain-containing protein [Streptomyces sp. HNM0574]